MSLCNLCKRCLLCLSPALPLDRHKPSSFWKKGGPGHYHNTIRQEFLLYRSYWVARRLRTYLSSSTLLASSNQFQFPKAGSHENNLDTNTGEQSIDSIPAVQHLLSRRAATGVQKSYKALSMQEETFQRGLHSRMCSKRTKIMFWLTYRVFIHPETKQKKKNNNLQQ